MFDIPVEIVYIEMTMAGLLRFVFFALLAYLGYLLYRFFKAVSRASQRPKPVKNKSGLMVKDEVCNTYLPEEDAIRFTFEGKDYYFCSNTCKQKFLDSKKTH